MISAETEVYTEPRDFLGRKGGTIWGGIQEGSQEVVTKEMGFEG